MKNVAVLGATGMVGREVLKILEQRNYPIQELFLFASERSEGTTINFKDREIEVLAEYESFIDQTDLAFSCLDEPLAREIVPKFQAKDKLVIDNSSAFRQEPDVPLVIPEVNPEKIREHKFIIANPNCSTIQMLLALYPLHRESRIKRIFVATYQAVSGYGRAAVDELMLENEYLAMGEKIPKCEESVFPHPIGANVIPQIGGFNPEGYSKEEMKLVNETRKILGDNEILVTATCVRVPVMNGHSEAVSVEFEQFIPIHLAKDLLRKAPGVKLLDDHEDYPVPIQADGQDAVFVGRIRKDFVFENGLAMWIVADNIRKGAALNAVQIAELL
jgi:aspartate-semialdehyde dehydrogenase